MSTHLVIFTDYEQVAGEIRAPTRTLKIGAFLAVGLVTILYILVTLAYVSALQPSLLSDTKVSQYLACDYETITSTESDLGVAILFAPRVGSILNFFAHADTRITIGLLILLWIESLHCTLRTRESHRSSVHKFKG